MKSDDYSEKSDNIRQLAAMPPEQFVDHLTELHPHIDKVAPNIAPHVFSAATNAVSFLNSKLPNSGNELAQDKQLPPSQAQKKAWLDLHDIVNDPVSILDKVKDQTLNRHHLEAIQSVYPDIHQEMVGKMQEHLGEMKMKGGHIPYDKRVMISKFIGQPVDSTFTPQSMQAILQAATVNTGPEAQANQRAKGGKASGPALNQINKVNQIYQTPLQANQKRELKP